MAVLKKAVQALDPAPDKTKDITLLLALLSELCEQKVVQFTEQIEMELRTAGSIENKTIPVVEVLAKHKEYRAYVKDDAGKIATEVSGAIKKFIAGGSSQIVDGISSLVTTGIEAILGAGTGTQQEMSSYYVVVQSFGILRFDIRVWSRNIEAVGITKQIQNALAIVAYKSSVNISKISMNTFLIAYQGQLASMNIPEEEWQTYLTTAEDVFAKLKGEEPATRPASLHAPLVMRSPGTLYGSMWDETGTLLP